MGMTFRNISGRYRDDHLWIVISDPTENAAEVVIVNLSSWKAVPGLVPNDPTCILDPVPGAHPFVSRRSFVVYGEARVVSDAGLDLILAGTSVQALGDMPAGDLIRIQKLAPVSPQLGGNVLKILQNQGLC